MKNRLYKPSLCLAKA